MGMLNFSVRTLRSLIQHGNAEFRRPHYTQSESDKDLHFGIVARVGQHEPQPRTR